MHSLYSLKQHFDVCVLASRVCVCLLISPQTLQAHYCPEVSSLASQLLVSVNRKVEENIGKYLDRDDEEVRYL